MASTVFSAQFENLGELVKSLIFPVGVDTFPTELSGRLRHVFSPAGAVPETLAGYLCLGIGTGNRTGRQTHFKKTLNYALKIIYV